MLKPIETHYKGYRFRSRLEARWAVFFDAMGFDWVYEPEGFVLKDGTWYLPDFQIERPYGPYVEVKPYQLSTEERRKAESFSNHKAIILAVGEPRPIGYEILEPDDEPNYGGCIAFLYHDGEKGNWEFTCIGQEIGDDKLESACRKAKGARFEHRESGAPD